MIARLLARLRSRLPSIWGFSPSIVFLTAADLRNADLEEADLGETAPGETPALETDEPTEPVN